MIASPRNAVRQKPAYSPAPATLCPPSAGAQWTKGRGSRAVSRLLSDRVARRGDHPSGTGVAAGLVRPTRGLDRAGLLRSRGDRYAPYLALLRVGFAKPTGHPAAGALLPHRFTLAAGAWPAAVCSLLHFPAEAGLSSVPGAGPRSPVRLPHVILPARRPPSKAAAAPAPWHPGAYWRERVCLERGVVVVVLVVLFLLVPLAELAVIIAVGKSIGVLATLLLLLVFSVSGAWLAKREGLAAWRRFQLAMAEGRVPTTDVADGAMVLAAGALLLVPGFLTDLLGLVLLLPPARAFARRWVPALARRRASRRARVSVSDSSPSTKVTWGRPELEDRPPDPRP